MASMHHVLVFPLKPDSKEPAVIGWQQAATNHLPDIDAWWTENPDYNIGISGKGLCLVDLDKNKGGPENWIPITELQKMLGDEVPETLCVQTQGGGKHLYFKTPEGVEVANSVEKLGEGIDVRGANGYVVGPGSYIGDRGYQLIEPRAGRKIAMAPRWLIEQAKQKRERGEHAGEVVVEETPAAIEAAWEWMREHAPVAKEGDGGDLTTHLVAKRLWDFGVTLDTAREMFEWWNQNKAEPAWDLDALEDKLLGGRKYREKPIGIASPDYMPMVPELVPVDPGPFPAAAPAAPSVETASATKRGTIPIVSFSEAWRKGLTHSGKPLVDDVIDEGTFSVIYGASGSGKSFVRMDLGFHIAAGRRWNGHDVRQGPVAYIAAEGGTGAYKRMMALHNHYGVDEVPFYLIPSSLDLLRPDPAGQTKALIQALKAKEEEIGAPFTDITVDTLSRALAGGNENGPEDMGMIVGHFDMIRRATRAHLCAIHHTGHAEAHRGRGHSLLKAATDTEIEVFVHDKATKAFDFVITKQRDGDERKVKHSFILQNMPLGMSNRGKPISSAVVIATVTTSKDMDSPDLLRDAIAAKLEREGKATDTTVDMSFIIAAAKESQLAGFTSSQGPRGNAKNYRTRVERLLANARKFARIKRQKRGEYQCLFEASEEARKCARKLSYLLARGVGLLPTPSE
jgi:hypothetical protein